MSDAQYSIRHASRDCRGWGSNNRFTRYLTHQATPYPTQPPVPVSFTNNKMKIVELIFYNKFYCNDIFYVNFV